MVGDVVVPLFFVNTVNPLLALVPVSRQSRHWFLLLSTPAAACTYCKHVVRAVHWARHAEASRFEPSALCLEASRIVFVQSPVPLCKYAFVVAA